MKKVTFHESWVYLGQIYTPGETEIEDDVFEALEKRGAFDGKESPKPTLQAAQELDEAQSEDEGNSDEEDEDVFLATLKPLHADVIGALNNAGYTTLEQLRTASDDEIIEKTEGVGKATVGKMRLLISAG